MPVQSHNNHTRFEPTFHFFLLPLLLLCLIASIVHVVHQASPANVLLVPVILSVMLLAMVMRTYAMKVQDRVIRLEENVRLHALGIDPSSLTLRQMIALRFASDGEVPALAARAVAETMTAKQIKAAIVTWRPDHHRV